MEKMNSGLNMIYCLIVLFSGIQVNLSGQNFKFAAMSDSRGKYNGVNEPVLSALVNHLVENQKDAKFLFFMGDMVDGSRYNPGRTYNELLHWKKVMTPVYNNPNMLWPYIWPTVGNHEIQHREDENNFRKIFQDVFMNGPDDEKGLTYSFDYDKVHFISVNTDRWYYGDPADTADDRRDRHYIKHLDWLEQDLRSARERGIKHIFVFAHEMIYPIGGHLRDGLPNLGREFNPPVDSTKQWYLDQRQKYLNLLMKYKVVAHICGHEHIYGRQSVNGLWQIIAGSSGASLYNFNPVHSDQPDSVKPGDEMSYTKAVHYYKVLNYHHGPGKNSQASEDFFGLRTFQYLILDVQESKITVTTYGAFPKEGSVDEMEGEISIIDEFTIYEE